MEKDKNKKAFAQIGSVVDEVLNQYRRESDFGLTEVWRLWDGAVGDAIAKNARPAAFKGKLLLVHVTSSAWIHQLQFLKKDILRKVNEALGKELVEEIKFKIGPI
ncbi:MAG: DUF721 domain-containing protein [Pseudomonadota bacterium]